LDGDQYTIIWDEQFVPKTHHPAADYGFSSTADPSSIAVFCDAAGSARLPSIDIRPIVNAFSTHITKDELGSINKYHSVWADYHQNGVGSAQCMQLAEFASMAVDAAKTGNFPNAQDIMRLRPRNELYPSYIMNGGAPGPRSSTKALGLIAQAVSVATAEIDGQPHPTSADEDLLPADHENIKQFHAFYHQREMSQQRGDGAGKTTFYDPKLIRASQALSFIDNLLSEYADKYMAIRNATPIKDKEFNGVTSKERRNILLETLQRTIMRKFIEYFKTHQERLAGAQLVYFYVYRLKLSWFEFPWICVNYLIEVKKAAMESRIPAASSIEAQLELIQRTPIWVSPRFLFPAGAQPKTDPSALHPPSF
jgi:hypothetical protein